MRIHEDMEYRDCITALAEGNKKAEVLLVSCWERDKDNVGILFFSLDQQQTYGQAIWDAFEACGNNHDRFVREVLYGKVSQVQPDLR